MPIKNSYKRIVTSEKDRGAPLNVDNLEEFCRTARREGARGDTMVRTIGNSGTNGSIRGLAVDVHIEAEPEPEQTAWGGPAGVGCFPPVGPEGRFVPTDELDDDPDY